MTERRAGSPRGANDEGEEGLAVQKGITIGGTSTPMTTAGRRG